MTENIENIQILVNKICSFFPEYQNIMYKVLTTSQNMSNNINRIKKEFFDEVFIPYHIEMMENITDVLEKLQKQENIKYLLAIVDFIDLIYQNAFYDIFSKKFQELENMYPDNIKEAHLRTFNLIN